MSTADELWNDRNFIEKRIEAISLYQAVLGWRRHIDHISTDSRFDELLESSAFMLNKFRARLSELKLKK